MQARSGGRALMGSAGLAGQRAAFFSFSAARILMVPACGGSSNLAQMKRAKCRVSVQRAAMRDLQAPPKWQQAVRFARD